METNLGSFVFSGDLCNKPVSAVIEAAKAAGIDEELVYSIRPRNAFIRAARAIKAKAFATLEGNEGILAHKFKDDEFTVEFQFSAVFLKQHGVDYDSAAVVSFDKKSLAISCDNYTIKSLAERLFMAAQEEYKTNDIQMLLKRLLAKAGCRRIGVRDGVYFVPKQYEHTVIVLKKFLNALGFSYFSGLVTSEDKLQVAKEIVQDIKKTIAELTTEITELKKEDNLSKCIAKNRLKETRDLLRTYKEAADSLQVNLSDILQEAGEAGSMVYEIGVDSIDSLIAKVQQGKSTGIIADLVATSEEFEVPNMQKPREQVVIDFDSEEENK
jgi:hypothetical protein